MLNLSNILLCHIFILLLIKNLFAQTLNQKEDKPDYTEEKK